MKKLTKSANNRIVAGVLGGIAEYFRIDPTILRLIFIIAIFIFDGVVIPIYLLAIFVIPNADGKVSIKSTSETKVIRKHPVKKSQQYSSVKDDDDDWSDF